MIPKAGPAGMTKRSLSSVGAIHPTSVETFSRIAVLSPMPRFHLPALSLSIGLAALLTAPAFAADQATRDQVTTLLNQRKFADAKAILDKVVAAEPNDPEGWQVLGQAELALQNADGAVAAFEKAVALKPANSTAHLQLGNAYGFAAMKAGLFGKVGFAKKCKAAYDKAVELDPKNIDARWSVMEYCRQAPGILGGGMDGAYAQAAEIKKLDARRGRNAYASLYASEKKFPEAFALYEEAIQEKADDTDALYNIGRLAAQSGERLDRGLAALKDVIARGARKNDARVPSYMGDILLKQGDKPGAQAAYEAALVINPKHTPALEALRKLKQG